MDKPKIVEIKRPQTSASQKAPGAGAPQASGPAEEESEVPAQSSQPVEQTQQPQAPEEAGQTPSREQPETSIARGVQQPSEELSELEKSVLAEMRKRGEISADEERLIIAEIREEEKKQAEEGSRQTLLQAEKKEPSEDEKRVTGGVEVANEQPGPRVVEERDYSLVINATQTSPPQVKNLIKQERMGTVVVSEQSTLEKEAREQASRDAMAIRTGPGTPLTIDERQHAASLAEKIWRQKQAEKSWFYRLKKMLGLAGRDETATETGGFGRSGQGGFT